MTTPTPLDPTRDGTIGTDDDGRPTVTFSRHLTHPVERVWQALTDRDHNAAWIDGGATIEPRVGGEIHLSYGRDDQGTRHEVTGTITAWEPPVLLEWEEPGHRLRWELAAARGGCHLRFTDVFLSDPRVRNSLICGWHNMLDRFEEALGGRPTDFSLDTRERLVELYWHYRNQPR